MKAYLFHQPPFFIILWCLFWLYFLNFKFFCWLFCLYFQYFLFFLVWWLLFFHFVEIIVNPHFVGGGRRGLLSLGPISVGRLIVPLRHLPVANELSVGFFATFKLLLFFWVFVPKIELIERNWGGVKILAWSAFENIFIEDIVEQIHSRFLDFAWLGNWMCLLNLVQHLLGFVILLFIGGGLVFKIRCFVLFFGWLFFLYLIQIKFVNQLLNEVNFPLVDVYFTDFPLAILVELFVHIFIYVFAQVFLFLL